MSSVFMYKHELPLLCGIETTPGDSVLLVVINTLHYKGSSTTDGDEPTVIKSVLSDKNRILL